MVRLWLRNEVFDGVLPLRAASANQNTGVYGVPQGAGAHGSSQIFTLVRTLRDVHPQNVRYTTWITEAWRVLQWSEPAAKLFWEMLALFHEQTERDRRRTPGSFSPAPIDRRVGQAAELPINRLALYLFLHLTPDATMVKVGSSRTYIDAMWPSEEAPGAGSPKRAAHGAVTSPHSPSRLSRAGAGSVGLIASGRGGPLSPTRTRAMRLLARSTDEAHRLTFVKRHLPQILQLISWRGPPPPAAATPPGARHESGAGAVSAVAPEADFLVAFADVEALGFLIEGGSSLEEPDRRSLAQLCPFWSTAGAASGAAAASASVGKGGASPGPGRRGADASAGVMASALREWLAAALTVNEHVYPVPPSPAAAFFAEQLEETGGSSSGDGLGASPPHPSPKRLLGANSSSAVQAALGCASMALTIVAEPELAHGPLLVNCIARSTVLHVDDAPPGNGVAAPGMGERCRDLQVNHCHEAYIYVLTPVRFATVMGCSDCTVVIGAVAAIVRVVECERIQLVTCCRRISVGNCLDCVFSVFSASNPVLSGDNRTCQFAPYNTCYPRLSQHLRAAGLPTSSPPAVNLWNSPVDVSMMGVPTGGGQGSGVAPVASPGRRLNRSVRKSDDGLSSSSALMPPEQFYTLTVPVPCPDDIDPLDVENPFTLPMDYAAVLREREAAILELQAAIRGGTLSSQQQRDVDEVVRDKFTEWLVTTGNLRQVLDLVHLERGRRAPQGSASSWTSHNTNSSSTRPAAAPRMASR